MTLRPYRWIGASFGLLLAAGCYSLPEKVAEGPPHETALHQTAHPAAPADAVPPRPTVVVTGVQPAAEDAAPPPSPWQELRQRLK